MQATYDNFNSPSNKTFYDTFSYQTLSRTEKEIRLLKLLPGYGDEMIKCELLPPAAVISCPSYRAISYCAGDPERTTTIQVNGVDFNAFTNLANSLKLLRPSTHASNKDDKPDIFWADQICINQNEAEERSHQVGFMRDIYYHAEKVMVCLGYGKIYDEGIRVMKEMYEDIKAGLTVRNQIDQKLQHISTLDDEFEKIQHFKSLVRDFSVDNEINGEVLRRRSRKQSETQFDQDLNALIQVFNSPWWGRGWIHQEVIVSRRTELVSCSQTVDWIGAYLVYFNVLRPAVGVFMAKLLPKHVQDSSNLSQTELLMIREGSHEAQLSNLSFILSMSNLRKIKDCNGDLEELLKYSSNCNVSDRRDHVYAFLGLAAPRYRFEANYKPSNTPAMTFQEATKKIISCKKSLDVIRISGGRVRDSDLPSWVPDWSCGLGGTVVEYPIQRPIGEEFIDQNETDNVGGNPHKRFYASQDIAADAEFPLDCVLRVKALFIDQLAGKHTLGIPGEGPENRESTLVNWFLCMDIRETKYFTGEPLHTVFSACFCFNGGEERVSTADEGGLQQSDGLRTIKIYECVMSGNWRFFCSPKGFMGMAPAKACYTDLICVLLGASVPVVLRKEGGNFIFIGEMYVHGFMHGRAIEMMRRGELKVEEIDLY